ncbi:MAG: flavin reductase family protein [Telluria sp.]
MRNLDFAKWETPAVAARFSAEDFKRTLSRYATGVAVVTTVDDEQSPCGLAVNSFTSVSMEPPLVLWCLRRVSSVFDKFAAAPQFCVNVLGAHQVDLAGRFSAKLGDRFAGIGYEIGTFGCPVLAGVAATLECRTVAQHAAGDHLIFIGEVRACTHTGASPLIFHSKNYWTASDTVQCQIDHAADVVRASSLVMT